MEYQKGCLLDIHKWAHLNRTAIFEDPSLQKYVSPFPPADLMWNTSGLKSREDFAAHGVDIYTALSLASPRPLTEYMHILDFGCGCGRLARMFKGHPHKISACDIDYRHINWVNANLDFIEAKLSQVKPPIPYIDNEMDAIISISIFTHLTENSQDEFLAELHRVTRPGGILFLTVHGLQALERACNEQSIRDMLNMDDYRFKKARDDFSCNRHGFVLQQGHLTNIPDGNSSHIDAILNKIFRKNIITTPFEYGIAFHPETYIREHWGKWFNILNYHHGAIHKFQDIVVLEKPIL